MVNERITLYVPIVAERNPWSVKSELLTELLCTLESDPFDQYQNSMEENKEQ